MKVSPSHRALFAAVLMFSVAGVSAPALAIDTPAASSAVAVEKSTPVAKKKTVRVADRKRAAKRPKVVHRRYRAQRPPYYVYREPARCTFLGCLGYIIFGLNY
jgi:hypothetical protein